MILYDTTTLRPGKKILKLCLIVFSTKFTPYSLESSSSTTLQVITGTFIWCHWIGGIFIATGGSHSARQVKKSDQCNIYNYGGDASWSAEGKPRASDNTL